MEVQDYIMSTLQLPPDNFNIFPIITLVIIAIVIIAIVIIAIAIITIVINAIVIILIAIIIVIITTISGGYILYSCTFLESVSLAVNSHFKTYSKDVLTVAVAVAVAVLPYYMLWCT